MCYQTRINEWLNFSDSIFLFSASINTFAVVDVDAAKALVRPNSCFKCHGTDTDKVGSAFTKVAAKFRGNPTAEIKLIHRLTSGAKAKFPDGHAEDRKIINTKDVSGIKNPANWILSL